MVEKTEGPLKRGWTTGACATAATRAAYAALLTGDFPDPVTITLPKGRRPAFALARRSLERDGASAAIVKDAGDDPDVTHGALVTVRVRRGPAGAGVRFFAGEGVGTVTLPGLPVPVGAPAINPVPRRMMRETVEELAARHGDPGDVDIEIAIPGGERLARRTMNGRLGISGGLSILGTTGVVTPYSCAAWIASIRQGVDVARAAGLRHVAAATGSTSEAAVARLHGLPEIALIDMGDFAGGALKYLRRHPVPRLTIAGGFAKIGKLGAGLLDLHSARGRVDTVWLADRLAEVGAAPALVEKARRAETAARVLALARAVGLPLADAVAARARTVAREVLDGGDGPMVADVAVDVAIFDRAGRLIGRADG